MSWFGDTFGDSLTTLKGQITKITKEVSRFGEDESFGEKKEEESTSANEFEASCSFKDSELERLRKELDKHQSEIELLKSENERYKSICSDNESRVDRVGLLESELNQIKTERNYLNSCLDELQAEHQVNLDEAVSIKDKYKRELEELRESYNVVKLELDELSERRRSALASSECKMESNDGDVEVNSLRSEIERLRSELVLYERREQELKIVLEKEEVEKQKMKEKLEKLSVDIKVIEEEKARTEIDNKNIRLEIENLHKKYESAEQENGKIKVQLKNFEQEKEELLKKCKEINSSKMCEAKLQEVELKLRETLQKIDINIEGKDNRFDKLVDLIEKNLMNYKNNETKMQEEFKQMRESSEAEIKKMNEENSFLQNEIKLQVEKLIEKEKKCQNNITIGTQTSEEEMDLKSQIISETERKDQVEEVKRVKEEVKKLLDLCEMKMEEVATLEKSRNDFEQELSSLKAACGFNDEVKKADEEEVKKRNREAQLEVELSLILRVESKDLNGHILDAIIEILTSQFDSDNEIKNLQIESNNGQSEGKQLHDQNNILQVTKNKLEEKNNGMNDSADELQKWIIILVYLKRNNFYLMSLIKDLKWEIFNLATALELLHAKDTEIGHLREANSNFVESSNRLYHELQTKIHSEQLLAAKENQLHEKLREQEELILKLQCEKNALNSEIQKVQDQIKMHIIENQNAAKSENVQQHRRSKSDANLEVIPPLECDSRVNSETSGEVKLLKEALENEKAKYRNLHGQFQEVSEREGNARREFERLKQHLIEIEHHYTEEAVENEKIINDLKLKLMTAEDQLKNSSTLYTSAKIRDNQHLESLQSQVRLISAQRDDLQARLSATEDEIQKHKASLTSLQIVLEQFQQDKEQEMQAVAAKCEKQIKLSENHYKELEMEIDGLKKQLSEAKNGLKAASRLGEQLEKKTQEAMEFEQSVNVLQNKITDLEGQLQTSNQTFSSKVDKSLIKNLLMGYILSPKADRKSQVLRIMAAALDFDAVEREKMGVDNTNSGWLANILHPKSDTFSSGNESLSEAFIKFLENESRPQPQLNLLPAQVKGANPRPSSSSPKPHGVLSELTLPTFNSPGENESSVILKNVLKDS